MTIKQANNIFKTKYPTGEIVQRGCMGGASSVATCVIYKSGGKVYKYNVQNYVELLNRLGFKVLYKKQIEAMQRDIKKMEKVIADGGKNNIFFGGFVELSEDEKQRLLNTIEEYQDSIKNSIAVNG